MWHGNRYSSIRTCLDAILPPPHCRRRRILDLDPVLGATGAVGRAQPLRHHALAAEPAGLPVDDVAGADVVLLTAIWGWDDFILDEGPGFGAGKGVGR